MLRHQGSGKLHWPTHVLIADKIQKLVYDKLNKTLHMRSLKIGALKPDFAPEYIKIKHFKQNSFETVNAMIEKISEKTTVQGKADVWNFSHDLGIIMHYITDFFCYAHNHRDEITKLDHLLYEIKLAREYKKADFSRCLEDSWNNVEEYRNKEYGSIKDYIQFRHEEYMKEPQGIENDIKYSLEMCITLSLLIVDNVEEYAAEDVVVA